MTISKTPNSGYEPFQSSCQSYDLLLKAEVKKVREIAQEHFDAFEELVKACRDESYKIPRGEIKNILKNFRWICLRDGQIFKYIRKIVQLSVEGEGPHFVIKDVSNVGFRESFGSDPIQIDYNKRSSADFSDGHSSDEGYGY